ncbi:hypothetical protein MINTM018_52810 (plasmid) [Mycobacterium intracellulare]|uniref:Uncharacterized protein n=1 Tax=Mycobacterium intracellulare TaxID=1767 RepID=A0A7R7RRR6_MYCIT|nr:hypothetical protein MINTM018_52810 [Mycobacterium intracellulare]
MHSCNCMYGTQDPRCCVAKARRRELEEAHRLGREGKPLPDERPVRASSWHISINNFDSNAEEMLDLLRQQERQQMISYAGRF